VRRQRLNGFDDAGDGVGAAGLRIVAKSSSMSGAVETAKKLRRLDWFKELPAAEQDWLETYLDLAMQMQQNYQRLHPVPHERPPALTPRQVNFIATRIERLVDATTALAQALDDLGDAPSDFDLVLDDIYIAIDHLSNRLSRPIPSQPTAVHRDFHWNRITGTLMNRFIETHGLSQRKAAFRIVDIESVLRLSAAARDQEQDALRAEANVKRYRRDRAKGLP
jgi:hypothetical protein